MIGNVQLLRMLAATSVVVFHSALIAKLYGHAPSLSAHWGAAGVDVFFVISGFIMVIVQKKTRRSALDFLFNRLYRIAPLYWILTITLVVLAFILPAAFRSGSSDPINAIANVIRSMFFLSLAHGTTPVLYVGWTLEYEMFFYAAFSAAILLGTLKRSVIGTAGVIFSFVALGWTGPLAIEFVFGMMLGAAFIRGILPKSQLIALLMLVCALTSIVVTGADAESNHALRVVAWGLPALAIVSAALTLPQIGKGILTFLGDASYSIYLVQVFSISAFYKLTSLFFPSMPTGAACAGAILVTILAGSATHLIIEVPMTRLIGSLLRHKAAPQDKSEYLVKR